MSTTSASGGGGAGGVVRQGHLRKLKTMKKKFFVLRAEGADNSARLEYYESEKKYKAGAAPRRVLPLKSCYNILRRLDLKQKHVIALFTREEQFCIVAENEQDLHAWLADILKQHCTDDVSEELLHPIQHVWQVNVQKKGLGATKNIYGLYNLCLTDKTLTLVKIKSHNNVISELGIPERVEYSLKNIRRCGDSECFFYMEVGRQTTTGAGELWMHSDDSNIAQSMHSTIYHILLGRRIHTKCAPLFPDITAGSAVFISATKRGTLQVINNTGIQGTPEDVWYCPEVSYNLLSMSRMQRAGLTITFNHHGTKISKYGKLYTDASAMRNCAKESENERDHIVIPKNDGTLPARRQTYSDGRGRAGLLNEKGLCVGSCIRQCVCSSATYSIEDSAAALAPIPTNAEYQQNNTLTEKERVIKHHRTVSLPTGCPLFQEPLKICHGRTHSAPLTGDELDKLVESNASTVKPVNGIDGKKSSARRASTGMRLSKLSPAHSKNAGTLRNRCDSMPSRTSFEIERPPLRHNDLEGVEVSRDETDAVADWYRTPRIPEEPDLCDISKDLFNMSVRPGGSISIQHSRTSSMGVEDGNTGVGPGVGAGDTSGYLSMEPSGGATTGTSGGYLPMAPGHESLAAAGLLSASSGSVCSGTPSTDPRFSEYTLEPATSHFAPDARPPRAYSVGSRPAPRGEPRHRAYSVGARARPAPVPHHTHPRASVEDLMMLDFSNNSSGARTPPSNASHSIAVAHSTPRASRPDEYVDMSPRNAGYVEMRPGETPSAPALELAPPPPPPVTDGYVEMSYGRLTSTTRPIAIGASRPPPPAASSPEGSRRTPLGSQTLFPFSLESPASPPTPTPLEDEMPPPAPTPLATVAEETMRRVPPPVSVTAVAASCSPQYVRLAMREPPSPSPATHPPVDDSGAAVVVAGGTAAPARFAVPPASPAPVPSPLNYAALDLEPRRAPQPPAPRTYTQIDFVRSEKLHAADAT